MGKDSNVAGAAFLPLSIISVKSEQLCAPLESVVMSTCKQEYHRIVVAARMET